VSIGKQVLRLGKSTGIYGIGIRLNRFIGLLLPLLTANRLKLSCVALRYMNVYGNRQPLDGAYSGVVPSMIQTIVQGQPPLIHGDGSQVFDFVHVADVARANILAMQSDHTMGEYNIGTGVDTSIASLARIITDLSGVNVMPVYQPDPAGPDRQLVTRRVGDITLAKQYLKFQAKIQLIDGLANQIQTAEVTSAQVDDERF
jgi:UDP-glucose 4-epimerase